MRRGYSFVMLLIVDANTVLIAIMNALPTFSNKTVPYTAKVYSQTVFDNTYIVNSILFEIAA